jgi:hypothetical protein
MKLHVDTPASCLLTIAGRESVKRPTATVLVLAALLAGCVAPSVPVPPPEPANMSFALDTSSGTATYTGGLGADWSNSWVSVFDDTTGKGVLDRSDATGHVGPTEPWRANDGDHVRIVFERDDGEQAGLCLILRGGPSSSGNRCTN